MKKIISMALIVVFALSLAMPAFASSQTIATEADNNEVATLISTEIITADDGGDYYEINVYQFESADSMTKSTQASKGTYTVSGYRDIIRRNGSGTALWEYRLNGTYTVNHGISVSCTSASYKTTIYYSEWKFSQGSTSISVARAYGSGVFKQYLMGFIVLDTVNINSIGLSCDVYGVLYI